MAIRGGAGLLGLHADLKVCASRTAFVYVLIRSHGLVLLFVNTVTHSCLVRPVGADMVWPTAKAVGWSITRRAKPRQGSINTQEILMSPLAGLLAQREPTLPAL